LQKFDNWLCNLYPERAFRIYYKKMPNFLNTPISTFFNSNFWKKNKEARSREFSNIKTRGQLAVDVFQTEDDIVILAPIAGIKIEDVEVLIQEDVLTIRGIRSLDLDIPQKNFHISWV